MKAALPKPAANNSGQLPMETLVISTSRSKCSLPSTILLRKLTTMTYNFGGDGRARMKANDVIFLICNDRRFVEQVLIVRHLLMILREPIGIEQQFVRIGICGKRSYPHQQERNAEESPRWYRFSPSASAHVHGKANMIVYLIRRAISNGANSFPASISRTIVKARIKMCFWNSLCRL